MKDYCIIRDHSKQIQSDLNAQNVFSNITTRPDFIKLRTSLTMELVLKDVTQHLSKK